MGKKGSSNTTVQSYTPTADEVRLQKQAADYASAVSPNALQLNDIAAQLLNGSYGTVQADYNQMNANAQNQIGAAQQGVANLTNGVLPAEFQKNMENSIKSGVQNSMGNLLSDYGGRGVLNSSVTNTGIQGINDSAASAMANAYNDNIATLSQLYAQQNDQATSGIAASAAAQEAAQQPALNLWNASLGLNGATTGALGALAGKGTTTSTNKTSGGSGLLGGVLGGLAGNAGLFCFTGETEIMTPEGNKAIRYINVGDKIICPNDNGADSDETVTEVMKPHYSDVYTIVCEKGNVSTTLSQPIMTTDGSFITVNSIGIGCDLKGKGKVKSIIYSGERKVYDIKLTGGNNYYANGFIVKGGSNEW